MFQAAAKVAVFSVCLLAVTFPATAQSNYQVVSLSLSSAVFSCFRPIA